jgi:hypothetical protein
MHRQSSELEVLVLSWTRPSSHLFQIFCVHSFTASMPKVLHISTNQDMTLGKHSQQLHQPCVSATGISQSCQQSIKDRPSLPPRHLHRTHSTRNLQTAAGSQEAGPYSHGPVKKPRIIPLALLWHRHHPFRASDTTIQTNPARVESRMLGIRTPTEFGNRGMKLKLSLIDEDKIDVLTVL